MKIFECKPISLIGCMYEVLANLLENRLIRVTQHIIGDT